MSPTWRSGALQWLLLCVAYDNNGACYIRDNKPHTRENEQSWVFSDHKGITFSSHFSRYFVNTPSYKENTAMNNMWRL
uniref:Putative secreted protein synganglion overexpressed n=1 Tax=Rhipicephalus microplus TaxID=6941 RepID=A0A6M2DDX9_RHIMP